MTRAIARSLRTLLLSAVCVACAQAQKLPSPPADIWEAAMQKFEAADRRSPPPEAAVLFIGSSSIALWSDLAAAFAPTPVINRGFGGSEIADSTRYVERIVTPHKPRIVVLYAGDNDLASGKTPQRVFEDYRAFVFRVRQALPETRIAFVSIKPSPARWHLIENIRTVNAMIRAHASQGENLAYLDVFTPMLGADAMPREELFAADRLHLSAEGYRLWRSVIAPYITR